MSWEWKYKRISWKIIKFLDVHMGIRLNRKMYYNKKILSIEESNDALKRMIEKGEPFAAGRIGGSELKAMISCQPESKNDKLRKEMRSLLICLSGFFGDDKDFQHFNTLMEESLKSMDFIGVWYNQMEDYMISHYGSKNVLLGKLEGLEPWYCKDNPWTSCLKGKKVVCVHPFKDTILMQYKKREDLFPGTDILPAFDLRCVKAVQTLMGEEDERFTTWFEALDYMYEEVMKEEFDIALISCGAYGLPLAAKIKEAGKQAVHVGGALQLLFGIKGSRWDEFSQLKDVYNDAWQYPLACDHLSKNRKDEVENGCYW